MMEMALDEQKAGRRYRTAKSALPMPTITMERVKDEVATILYDEERMNPQSPSPYPSL